MLLSVWDMVSSVCASLDRDWSSLSCADVGAYETWYGFASLLLECDGGGKNTLQWKKERKINFHSSTSAQWRLEPFASSRSSFDKSDSHPPHTHTHTTFTPVFICSSRELARPVTKDWPEISGQILAMQGAQCDEWEEMRFNPGSNMLQIFNPQRLPRAYENVWLQFLLQWDATCHFPSHTQHERLLVLLTFEIKIVLSLWSHFMYCFNGQHITGFCVCFKIFSFITTICISAVISKFRLMLPLLLHFTFIKNELFVTGQDRLFSFDAQI